MAVNNSSSMPAFNAAVRWYELIVSKIKEGEGAEPCADIIHLLANPRGL
jgi:hypothetical protein